MKLTNEEVERRKKIYSEIYNCVAYHRRELTSHILHTNERPAYCERCDVIDARTADVIFGIVKGVLK